MSVGPIAQITLGKTTRDKDIYRIMQQQQQHTHTHTHIKIKYSYLHVIYKISEILCLGFEETVNLIELSTSNYVSFSRYI